MNTKISTFLYYEYSNIKQHLMLPLELVLFSEGKDMSAGKLGGRWGPAESYAKKISLHTT